MTVILYDPIGAAEARRGLMVSVSAFNACLPDTPDADRLRALADQYLDAVDAYVRGRPPQDAA